MGLSSLSNEVLFFIAFALNFLFLVAAFRLGKNALFLLMGVNLLFTAFFGGKLFDFFGFMLSASLFTYASLFVIGNVLVEHFGKKEAEKAIWAAFLVFVAYLVYQLVIIGLTSHPSTQSASQALAFVLSTTPRLVLASAAAYLASQFVNIWAYEQLMNHKFGKKHLWIRTNGATLLGQLVDCFVFFPVAFLHVLPNTVLLQLILITFAAKALLSVLNTPALYVSKKLLPR